EYTHAAPLDPGALIGFWERCGRNPTGVEVCRPGLHAAQRLVRGDSPPDSEDWLKSDEPMSRARHAAPAPERDEGGDDAEL
ncbi:MAG: hypothetical protein ACREI7_05570, partial [Myxococcota bacterium]